MRNIVEIPGFSSQILEYIVICLIKLITTHGTSMDPVNSIHSLALRRVRVECELE